MCRVEWFDLALAEALLAQGDLDAARRRIEGIETVARASGFPLVVEQLTVVKGQLEFQAGRLPVARALWEMAYSIGVQLGCPWYKADAGHRLGRLARAEDDSAGAEDQHLRALALCVRHGFRGLAAAVLEALASPAMAGGSDVEAARLFGAAGTLGRRRASTGGRRTSPGTTPTWPPCGNACRRAG